MSAEAVKPAAKPVPRTSGELEPFFAAAKRRRLAVQRCAKCGTLRFPPREICSVVGCWSRNSEWTEVSGRGELWSFYVMHQVYHPGFAAEVPYPVVVVKLAEGPKIMSSLLDCPRDRIRVGMPLEVAFEDVTSEVTLPKFRPASS